MQFACFQLHNSNLQIYFKKVLPSKNIAFAVDVNLKIYFCLQKHRQQSAIDDLERKLNGCKADIEDVEDKQRAQEEKIFGLEEAAVSQAERATYVEQLRGELGALNEQKQQSEARLKV